MIFNDLHKQRVRLKKKIMNVKWSDPASYSLSLQEEYRDLLNHIGKLKQRRFKLNKIFKNDSNKTRC
jgi:uncharacterized protein YdcH (DUF465 family)